MADIQTVKFSGDENIYKLKDIYAREMAESSQKELIDIRVGSDGTTYASAGTAVREQVRLLNNALDEVATRTEVVSLNLNDEQYEYGTITGSGDLMDATDVCRSVNYLPVEGGRAIKLYSEDCNYLHVAEYDSSYQFLSRTEIYSMQHSGDGISTELTLSDSTRYIKIASYALNPEDKITIYYSENAKEEYVPYKPVSVDATLRYEKIYDENGRSVNEIIDEDMAAINSIYTKNTFFELPAPTVTVGSLESQRRISKDNRSCPLWKFDTVGAMEIKGINIPFDKTTDTVGIWIYINQEAVTWGDDTDGVFKVYVDGAEILSWATAYHLHAGWNYLKLDLSEVEGAFDLKFEFTMVRGRYEFAVDTIELNYRTRTQVLLSFDMFGEDGYNVRYPLLDSYGFKATFCNPDQGLTADMRQELFAKGWDWAIYNGRDSAGITRPDFYTGTADEWYEYLKPAVDSCAEIGLFNPISYFCPENRGTPAIMEALQRLGFKMGRMSASGNYYTEYFNKNSFYIYTWGVGGTTTAEDTLAMLDTAIADGTSVCIFTHQVQDTLTDNMHCTREVYTAILDGIKERVDAGLCDVVTFREFYRHWLPEDCAEHLENRHQKEMQYILGKIGG